MAARYEFAHDDTVTTYNGMGLQKIERDYCLVVTNLLNRRKVKVVKPGGGLLWANVLGNKFLVRHHNILTIHYDSPIYSDQEQQDLFIQSGVTVKFDIDVDSVDISEEERKSMIEELAYKLYPKQDDETEVEYQRYVKRQVRTEEFQEEFDKLIEKRKRKLSHGNQGNVRIFISNPDIITDMGKEIESIISLIIKNSKYNELLGGPVISLDNIPEYLDDVDETKYPGKTHNIRRIIREKLLKIQRECGVRNIQIIYPDINLPQSIISAREAEKASEIKNRQDEAQAASLVVQARSRAEAKKEETTAEVDRKRRLAEADVDQVKLLLEAMKGVYPDADPAFLAASLRDKGTNVFINNGGIAGRVSQDRIVEMATLAAMADAGKSGAIGTGNPEVIDVDSSSLNNGGRKK